MIHAFILRKHQEGLQLETIKIRKAYADDLTALLTLSQELNLARDIGYFEQVLGSDDAKDQCVFLAERDDVPLGFVVLNWVPKYGYYKSLGCSEIQDLNVLPVYRNRGIGSILVKSAEAEAREKGHEQIGISVGLTASYGPAQRLYVHMGYVPDGYGVTYDRQAVTHGEFRSIDDDLCLMMVKGL